MSMRAPLVSYPGMSYVGRPVIPRAVYITRSGKKVVRAVTYNPDLGHNIREVMIYSDLSADQGRY